MERRVIEQLYKEEDLFAAALALPAAERVHYLERACGKDIGLFARLQALLDKFDDAERFISDRSSTSRDGTEQIGPQSASAGVGRGRLWHRLLG